MAKTLLLMLVLLSAALIRPALAEGEGAGSAPSTASPAPGDATATTAAPVTGTSAAAPGEPVPAAANIDEALLQHDLSPWGMFRNADIVVQVVMGGLAFASIITWTVFLAKAWQLLWLNRQMAGALRRLETAISLETAQHVLMQDKWQGSGLGMALLSAAMREIDLSGHASAEGIKERVASRFDRLAALTARGMNRGTGILATIGSTAPFVGLFGTVWGIMNSFIGISQAHTTNLAVVAPGIAEALLATAIGLVAAIPAVVVYNLLARAIAANKAVAADMSAAVLRLVSRDLDHDQIALSRAA